MNETGFTGKRRFLSNFHPSPLKAFGEHFPDVETAYQWAKCADFEGRALIMSSATPGQAKRFGRTVKMRTDWDDIKRDIMWRLVLFKFVQNPLLAEKLTLLQGPIVEYNTWGDTYWGVSNGVGENNLGQILESIRLSLIDDFRFFTSKKRPEYIMFMCGFRTYQLFDKSTNKYYNFNNQTDFSKLKERDTHVVLKEFYAKHGDVRSTPEDYYEEYGQKLNLMFIKQLVGDDPDQLWTFVYSRNNWFQQGVFSMYQGDPGLWRVEGTGYKRKSPYTIDELFVRNVAPFNGDSLELLL